MYKIQQSNEKENNQNNSYGVDQSRQQLINFIYDRVNLSNFKYDSLEVESELPQLISKNYYVSANFSGSSCLLVFAKIKDKYHQFLVDRKTLSYNVKKVDIKNVKIIPVKINLDLDIYQGSIFDGIFVQGKNDRTFIITDVYLFKGQDQTKSHLNSKLFTIKTYLESNYKDDKNNDLTVTVNMIFPMDKTRHLIENVIPKIKNFLIRGICFYPEISGTKLLFKFGNENENNLKQPTNQLNQSNQQNQSNLTFSLFQKKQNMNSNNNKLYQNNTDQNFTNKDIQNMNNEGVSDSESNKNDSLKNSPIKNEIIPKAPEIKKIVKHFYVPKEGKEDTSYVFEMKKTENIDVYKLSILERIEKDSKKYWKRKQACLAYIPNISRSKWCEKIMEENDGTVMVNCKFYKDKNKWEPITISTESRPSTINDFDVITDN